MDEDFQINPFPVQNYLQVAKERSTVQWEDKEVFQKYLEWMFGALQDIQLTLRDLKQLRSIDSAQGEQLDIIGRIVGQPREIIDSDMLSFFAFQGYPLADSYGDLNDNSVGGIFRSLDAPITGNVLLNDDQYRLFIKAKIVRNTTNATPNEFLRFLGFVFGAELSNTIIEGSAEFTVLIGKDLTPFEQTLLQYESINEYGQPTHFIPKPIGVSIGFGEFQSDNYFGFQGSPAAKGYGSLIPDIAYDGSYVHDGEILYTSGGGSGYVLEPGVGGVYASLIEV